MVLDSTILISSQKLEGHIKYQLSKAIDSLSFSIVKKENIDSKFSLFGFCFDNNKHGISYHSIGVNGASVPSYLRCINLEKQLDLALPDLVIFSIGINDAYENDFSKESYSKNYDSLIQRIYSVNPEAAILFTTNNDSYYHRKYPNKRVFQAREVMFELTKNKSFEKSEKIKDNLSFEYGQNKSYSITLTQVSNGNLRIQSTSENEFFN